MALELHAAHVQFDVVVLLRYSDWATTMPLLVLKMHALALDGDVALNDDHWIVTWEVRALLGGLAVAMIACGLVAELTTQQCRVLQASGCRFAATHTARTRLAGPLATACLYIAGCTFLLIIYAALYVAAAEAETRHAAALLVFTVAWSAYPCVSIWQRIYSASEGVANVCFALLDVACKVLPALHVAYESFPLTTTRNTA